jgi:hypothetical protein
MRRTLEAIALRFSQSRDPFNVTTLDVPDLTTDQMHRAVAELHQDGQHRGEHDRELLQVERLPRFRRAS